MPDDDPITFRQPCEVTSGNRRRQPVGKLDLARLLESYRAKLDSARLLESDRTDADQTPSFLRRRRSPKIAMRRLRWKRPLPAVQVLNRSRI